MRQLVFGVRVGLAVIILMVLCTFGIIAVLLGMGKQKALKHVMPRWARLSLLACSLNVEVQGREHLDAHRPCIFVANHQGLLDALVFPTILDAPMFYPIKKELVWVPFMGWFAWITDQPRIDRDDSLQSIQAMDKVANLLKEGQCTLMFPEGTRCRDGKLAKFKKGAFRLAMDTGVPIIPVTLIDCYDHMPMGTFNLKSGTIHVVVDEPIRTDGWDRASLARNVLAIRERFARNIEEGRARLGLPPAGSHLDPEEGAEPLES